MNTPVINDAYLRFRMALEVATQIDPCDYANWIRDNLARLNQAVAVARLSGELPDDETGAWVRAMYVREKALL